MSLIKFKDYSNHLQAQLSMDYFGRLTLIFEDKDNVPTESILTNGFIELNEHNLIEQADFSNMNYIFRKINDYTYILTKDKEDNYKEPELPNTNQEYIPEQYIPTVEDLKKMKISSLSSECNRRIKNGIYITINDLVEHFSYTEEDQTNIKELFDLALQTNVPLYYHSDGNSCKLYTAEQIIMLYTSAAMNKMHHITYFNQLKMYVNSLEDADSIIDIEYGIELTGEYLATFNAAMRQAKVGMETLLKAGQSNEE